MKLSIMQPYFLPYIGYFQLIASTDVFVLYDNIKYTKKGWINRNRLLLNGKDALFSLNLKSGSDALDVCDREIALDFNRDKLLNQFRGAYRRAPYFVQVFPLLEKIVQYSDQNLFGYLHNSIVQICAHLGLSTKIQVSSTINIDHGLKGQEKVIAICQALGADTYVNSAGGVELYELQAFKAHGLELKFIRSKPLEYEQFGGVFVPWLSIVDVMMFNAHDKLNSAIHRDYELF